MGQSFDSERQRKFCETYLRTMDPVQAARAAGRTDGYRLLREKAVQERLEQMRSVGATRILREDAVRRLTELAFGRANDAVALALAPPEARPDVNTLNLSAVAEFKVTDKGSVEIKFLDRIRALETLCTLLDGRITSSTSDFFQALEDAEPQECGA